MRALLMLAMVTLGCGGVATIDVHDERVPLEARLWVGGADDAVAIAQAGLDDARTALVALERWREASDKKLTSGALAGPFAAFAGARLGLARARVEHAQAELELAKKARTLVHAETAMRYDLAVYPLAELRTERDVAQKALDVTARTVEEAMAARETASAAFWSAYRAAYGQNAEVGRLFWTGGE